MFSFKGAGAKSPEAPEALFSAADGSWTHFSHRWGGDTPLTSRGPWAGTSWLHWSPVKGRDWPAELTGNFLGQNHPSLSYWAEVFLHTGSTAGAAAVLLLETSTL